MGSMLRGVVVVAALAAALLPAQAETVPTITVGGEALTLLPQKAAFLPNSRTLLVADAHIGKAVSFRRLGVPVPAGTTGETLARLDAALAVSAAQRIVFLGGQVTDELAINISAKLLLLDEISEGLAPVIVQALARMIMMLREKGYTVVMVEQNFRFAAPLADRFYVMEHGRIVEKFGASELEEKMPVLTELLGV